MNSRLVQGAPSPPPFGSIRPIASGAFLAVHQTAEAPRVTISFHRLRPKCYPDSTSTSGALYFSGYPDFWETKFVQAYLRLDDSFLDIGANTGVYSILFASSVGTQGTIDAFEPGEAAAARLEEQTAMNGLARMRVHRLAVCERIAELDFGFSGTDATIYLGGPSQSHAASECAGRIHRCGCWNWPYIRTALASPVDLNAPFLTPQSGMLEYTNTPWTLGVQNVLAVLETHRDAVEERLRKGFDPGKSSP